jgi:hypothetical protein
MNEQFNDDSNLNQQAENVFGRVDQSTEINDDIGSSLKEKSKNIWIFLSVSLLIIGIMSVAGYFVFEHFKNGQLSIERYENAENVKNIEVETEVITYGVELPNKLLEKSEIGSWETLSGTTQGVSLVPAENIEVILSDKSTSGIKLRTEGDGTASGIVMKNLTLPSDAEILTFCYLFAEPGDESWITVHFDRLNDANQAELLWTMAPAGDGSLEETVHGDTFMLDSFISIGSFAATQGDLYITLNNTGEESSEVNLTDFRILSKADLANSVGEGFHCLVNKAPEVPEQSAVSGEFAKKLAEIRSLQKENEVSFENMQTRKLTTISTVFPPTKRITLDGTPLSDKTPHISGATFSADGSMIAYSGRTGSGAKTERQFLGDVDIENHRSGVVFSDDGESYAYISSEVDDDGKEQLLLHVNDKKTLIAPYTLISDVGFFPGTDKVYFVGTLNKKDRLVVDGVEGPRYDEIGDLVFSENGQVFIYTVYDGDVAFIVEGANEGQKFWKVENVNFVSESGDYVYRGISRDGGVQMSTIVRNTSAGPQYRWVGGYYASEDGKTLVYPAGTDEEKFCVEISPDGSVNEHDGPYKFLHCYVSPDGKNVAYIATTRTDLGDTEQVVFNGEKQKVYDTIDDLSFSPDSSQYAYTAREITEEIVGEETVRTITRFVVSEGVDGQHFEHVNAPLFSHNGSMVYRAKESGKWLLVRDGQKTKSYGNLSILSFVGESDILMYQISEGDGQYLIFDDGKGGVKKVGPYSEYYLETMVFSDDFSQVAFGARKNSELWWVVERVN